VADDRYRSPAVRPAHDDPDYWREHAPLVVLDLLATHHAVTVAEMECRAADHVSNPAVCPWPIQPHHLTNARQELYANGDIIPTTAFTRSHPVPITTWSLPVRRGLARVIEDTAARKRLLTARHNGWSERGGAGRGLIGAAGEEAMAAALAEPDCPLTRVTGSTREALGLDLDATGLGEVDNSGFVVDQTDRGAPGLIYVMFEVKNTRSWFYADDDDVLRFLAKAAFVQHHRPDQLIFPVFVCRRVHWTLWDRGEAHGFLPARVENQLVLADHELTPDAFAEVRDELFEDMLLGARPTNRHLGIARTAVQKYAPIYARRWQEHYVNYLGIPVPPIAPPDV